MIEFDININAKNPNTLIVVGDKNMHLIETASGSMSITLPLGQYYVEFGMGVYTIPFYVDGCVDLQEENTSKFGAPI